MPKERANDIKKIRFGKMLGLSFSAAIEKLTEEPIRHEGRAWRGLCVHLRFWWYSGDYIKGAKSVNNALEQTLLFSRIATPKAALLPQLEQLGDSHQEENALEKSYDLPQSTLLKITRSIIDFAGQKLRNQNC